MKHKTSDTRHKGATSKAAKGVMGYGASKGHKAGGNVYGKLPGKKFSSEVGSPRVPKKGEATERKRPLR